MDNDKIVIVNEKSLMYKIKKFLNNLFRKTEDNEKLKNENILQNTKQGFLNDIKVSKSADNNDELISLKNRYDNGLIKEEDLSDKQVEDLIGLYDKQIEKYKMELMKYKIC